MAIGYGEACPKPEPRRKVKARAQRAEQTVKRRIRALVAARDGYCRVAGMLKGCDGVSEWAHLEDQRRSLTRGMAPAERHTTRFTAMLCTAHHRQYDAHKFRLQFLTYECADGPIAIERTR
jgi:hypothetical protein